MALLGVPDLPTEAFKHVGDRRIKPQGGGGGGQGGPIGQSGGSGGGGAQAQGQAHGPNGGERRTQAELVAPRAALLQSLLCALHAPAACIRHR